MIVIIISTLCALAGARVTLPFSEVIQREDLVQNSAVNGKASFNCDDGCKVYSDLASDDVGIAQNGQLIVNFTDAFGGNSARINGYVLPAGKDYDVRQVGNQPTDFVFYVVSKKAPNYDAAVYSPEGGITIPGSARFATFLSSANAVQLEKLTGDFPSGFPAIYATGADALSDVYGISQCKPVYRARSQANAEQSRPTIFAPILTVDFGFDGTHSVSANLTDGSTWAKSETSSVVYMSPGYVGCPFEGGSLYSSAMRNAKITDTFTLIADSLDIAADFNDVAPSETVFFVVNQDDLDFFNENINTTSLTRHYEQGAFKAKETHSSIITISWKRTTPNSSWALQLDFGTKSGSGLSLFLAVFVVSMFKSLQ